MALRTLMSSKTLGIKFQQFRGLQTTSSLPDLPYDYGALEPAISRDIMSFHHQKHHQAHITNYNKDLKQLDASIFEADSSTIAQLHA